MTDTVKEADLFLPTKNFFEQSDIITGYWHPYIQWQQKIFDPPPDVKSEIEIYYILAKKLGFNDIDLKEIIPNPDDDSILEFLQNKSSGLINISELKENVILPNNYQEIAFSDMKFQTPSGKIELYSKEAEEKWKVNPLPDYSEINFQSDEHIYPLHLLTPNTKNRIHSQFNNLDLIKEISPQPFISIHPVDAEERNICDGDLVEVFNDRGKIEIKATVDYSVKEKTVSITNGWWSDDGIRINLLSKGIETDMGFGAAFHNTVVEVRKS
jgi:anaerobic selenocysteine-containing dehydrogenase